MFPRHLVIAYSYVFFHSAVLGCYGWYISNTNYVTGAAVLSVLGCLLRLSGLYWPDAMERILTKHVTL